MSKKKIAHGPKGPVFSPEFLEPYIAAFQLLSVTDIARKRRLIKSWANNIRSGKIPRMNEMEIKSRFIQEFFCNILGFNSSNPTRWQLREELKGIMGATKPDAVLGSFRIVDGEIVNNIDIIIEMKGFNADLDRDQNRSDFYGTPVEQAFLYASKTGGDCKWIVVSNINEIRFYHTSGMHACQRYILTDLEDEEKLRELLYLFHKDRWTNSSYSSTDKLFDISKRRINVAPKKHILDELYRSLNKFDGLGYVDPNFIANMKIFNLRDEYVWHYEKRRLLCLNPAISDMLREIEFHSGGFTFSQKLQVELLANDVLEAEEKFSYIMRLLNSSLIAEICFPTDLRNLQRREIHSPGYLRHFPHLSDGELVSFKTKWKAPVVCDCINCLLRRFDFRGMIKRARTMETDNDADPIDIAYLHYILATDNYKKAYFIYKKADIEIKGDESSAVRYFISKINQLHLHNLVEGFNENQDSKEILKDIRSIDLDDSIHKELDIFVDPDVRHYLIDIKEENLFAKAEKKISDIHLRYLTKRKSSNDPGDLNETYLAVYSHFHKNQLVFDAFTNFTDLVTKVIECMVVDYNAATEQATFNLFYLTEAMLYVSNEDLKRIFAGCRSLKLLPEERSALIEKAINFLSSTFIESPYGSLEDRNMTEQLLNYSFEDKFTRLFSNLFLLLSNVDPLPWIDKRLAKPITRFIEYDNNIQQHQIRTFATFIVKFGMIFEFYQLEEMLDKCVKTDRYGYTRYRDLPSAIGRSMRQHYPEEKIKDSSLIRRAVASWTSSEGKANLVYHLDLYFALKEEDAKYLLFEIENSLQTNFTQNLYFHVLDLGIISWDYKEYFNTYVRYVQGNKHSGFTGFNEKGPVFTDNYMINLIFRIYHHGIDTTRFELDHLQNISEFETWALNPVNFPSEKFQCVWLLVVDSPFVLEKLDHVDYIAPALKSYLSNQNDKRLAEIYFKYFLV